MLLIYLFEFDHGFSALPIIVAAMAKRLYVEDARSRIKAVVASETDPVTIRARVSQMGGISMPGLALGVILTVIAYGSAVLLVIDGSQTTLLDGPGMELTGRLLLGAGIVLPAAIIAILITGVGYRRIPARVRDGAFAIGILCGLVTIVLQNEILLPTLATGLTALGTSGFLLLAFIATALPLEATKVACLTTLALRDAEAHMKRDAILAGALLGLGAATLQGILLISVTQHGPSCSWFRTTLRSAPRSEPSRAGGCKRAAYGLLSRCRSPYAPYLRCPMQRVGHRFSSSAAAPSMRLLVGP